jgi:hypothetical protein
MICPGRVTRVDVAAQLFREPRDVARLGVPPGEVRSVAGPEHGVPTQDREQIPISAS